MNKKLKLHLPYLSAILCLIIAGVGTVGLVKAYGEGKVINIYGNYIESSQPQEEGRLGGTTNLSDLSIDTLSVSGAVTLSATNTVSGQSVLEKVTTGGAVLATSTSGTATTLTQAELYQYGLWSVTPGVLADLTYTLPASNTLTSFLPNAGDRTEIQIYNVTSTATTDIILAAGTGIDLEGSTTSLKVLPQTTALLDCMRKVNTDVTCILRPFADLD
jgi:hypothetical protein